MSNEVHSKQYERLMLLTEMEKKFDDGNESYFSRIVQVSKRMLCRDGFTSCTGSDLQRSVQALIRAARDRIPDKIVRRVSGSTVS